MRGRLINPFLAELARLDTVATAADPDAGETGAVVRAQATGALPAFDRAARRAFRSAALERWVEQSGARLTVGGLVLLSLGLALTNIVWLYL